MSDRRTKQVRQYGTDYRGFYVLLIVLFVFMCTTKRVRSIVRESVLRNPFVLDNEGDPTTPAYVKDGIKISLQLWNEPIGVWPEALQVIRT